MNIFGIGPTELAVIFLIALIVAGPKRMLRWAYIMGQWVGKLRVLWAEVAAEIQREVDKAGLEVEVPKDIPTRRSVDAMARKALAPIADPVRSTLESLKFSQPDAPAQPPADADSGQGFGTWGADDGQQPPADADEPTDGQPASAGYGTWGQVPPSPR